MPELRHQTPRLRREEGADPDDLLLDALQRALEEQDVQLRNEFPDVFARVDELKSQPGWTDSRKPMPLPDWDNMPFYVREQLGLLSTDEKNERRAKHTESERRRRARQQRPPQG